MEDKQKSVTNFGLWFTIIGFLFGLLGVVIATVIALAMASLPLTPQNMIQVHFTNPLLWLFDLFPIIMAVLMGFLGSRERKYQQILRQYGAASQNYKTRLQQFNAEKDRQNQERWQWEEKLHEGQTELEAAQAKLAEGEQRFQQTEQIISRGKRQWEATFDAVSDLILMADESEQVVRCNQAVREALKLDYPDIIGRPLHELFYGERPASSESDTAEQEEPFPISASEAVFPRLPGWYQVTSAPVEVEQGQPGMIYILRNVTDRVEVTLDLQRQKQYYQALVKNMPVAIATLKLDRTIVDCNPAFEGLFGYTLEEVKGRPLDPLITPPEALDVSRALTESAAQGELVREVTQRQRKDGSLVQVEAFGIPVTLWGKRIAVLGLYHDISGLDAVRRSPTEPLAVLAASSQETELPPLGAQYLGTELPETEILPAELVEELPASEEAGIEAAVEAEAALEEPTPAAELPTAHAAAPGSPAYKVSRIEGIGPVYSRRLAEIGILTTKDLLDAGSTRKGRSLISEQSGISPTLVLEWVNRADLMRVPGVGEEFSDLLEASGVDTVKELRNRNPENLHRAMLEVNQAKRLVRRAPTLAEVSSWISAAKAMDVFVSY